MKDKPTELILIVVLLVVLFGGGFGFYRGGYYRQGGPVGIGGILGLILVVLVIGVVQTLASDRCADWLRRAAPRCLAGHWFIVFHGSRHRCLGHASRQRGVVDRRLGQPSNLRLQQPALRPDRLAADGATALDGWPATTRTLIRHFDSATVRPDRSSGATAGWS